MSGDDASGAESAPTPVVPPATIGMLGGGQLGRYALVAAGSMGYRTIVLDPGAAAPAGVVANEHLVAAYDDPGALDRLVERCQVVTTEFENPPAAALERLARSTRVAPSPAAVAVAQDRILEKSFLVERSIPVGPHVAVRAGADGDALARAHALADGRLGAIVKTARLGYDGRGQVRVSSGDELDRALAELGGVDVVVEARLDLERELSVLVARTDDGDALTWPVAENVHVDGILDVSSVPAPIEPGLADRAVTLASRVADELAYVGVLAVELFVVADADGDELLVNELAPRPHNSGHWTLDAAVTSQFEQQVRAVCGVGLGDVSMTAPAAAMVNLLGDLWFAGGSDDPVEPRWERALADPLATLHLYGKAEARPGRKMGHLTVVADTVDAAVTAALALRSSLTTP